MRQRPEIANLLDTLAHLPDRLEAASKTGYLPPSVTWTLITLFAYRERKKWAWEIIQPHVPEDDGPRVVSITDVLEGRRRGIVQQRADWEFEIDGNASFVRNRVTGELIHIDVENGPEVVSTSAFIEWIQRNLSPAAERLLDLQPSGEGISIPIELLMAWDVLHAIDVGEFEVCGHLHSYAQDLERFVSAWRNLDERLWLAVLIGDWPAALATAQTLGDDELISLITPRAAKCREEWVRYLENHARSKGLYDGLLYALADANCPELPKYVETAIGEDEASWAAIDIIKSDPSWCPKVYEYYQRSNWLAPYCASYLARHDYRTTEVIEQLVSGNSSYYKTAIELALEHAPEMLPQYLPQALRTSSRDNRLTAAAVLALLDADWSRRELQLLLDESSDQDATIECRAALRESTDPKVRKAAGEWEKLYPETDDANHLSDRFMYDLNGGCEKLLRRRMDELFDSVMQVRQSLSQDVEPSIDGQREKIERFASVYDHTIEDWFIGDGESGKNIHQREEFCRVLDRLRSDTSLGGLIVANVNRMTRSVFDGNRLLREFFGEDSDYGLRLISVDDMLSTDTAMGRFQFNMLLAVAQLEREQTVERVKATLDFKRSQGQRISRFPPYGLDYDAQDLAAWEAADSDARKALTVHVVENRHEIEQIEAMIAMHEDGRNMNQIRDHLNKIGEKTKNGSAWTHKQVGRVLAASGVRKIKKRRPRAA